MYNQRESLADIVITPALQAGGRGIVTLSAHHQPTENTSARFHLIACRAQAGGQFVRKNSGKLPKNCQGKENPQGPAGYASYGAGVYPADRPGHCEDETPAGSASRQRLIFAADTSLSPQIVAGAKSGVSGVGGLTSPALVSCAALPHGTHVGHAGGTR